MQFLKHYGSASCGGCYILLFHLNSDSSIIIGKFNHSTPIRFSTGYYIYIGSAIKSQSYLLKRVLRHCTRVVGDPHTISANILLEYPQLTLSTKKLHWNIDYVLESEHCNILQIYLFHTCNAIEASLSQICNASSYCFPVAKGLGASDLYNTTNLLQITSINDFEKLLHLKIIPKFDNNTL